MLSARSCSGIPLELRSVAQETTGRRKITMPRTRRSRPDERERGFDSYSITRPKASSTAASGRGTVACGRRERMKMWPRARALRQETAGVRGPCTVGRLALRLSSTAGIRAGPARNGDQPEQLACALLHTGARRTAPVAEEGRSASFVGAVGQKVVASAAAASEAGGHAARETLRSGGCRTGGCREPPVEREQPRSVRARKVELAATAVRARPRPLATSRTDARAVTFCGESGRL